MLFGKLVELERIFGEEGDVDDVLTSPDDRVQNGLSHRTR